MEAESASLTFVMKIENFSKRFNAKFISTTCRVSLNFLTFPPDFFVMICELLMATKKGVENVGHVKRKQGSRSTTIKVENR